MGFSKSLYLAAILLFASCSTARKMTLGDEASFVNDTLLRHAHAGIAVYDVAAKKYIIEHNAEKYFVPASNVKIATCYAALKYLGDSVVGLRYAEDDSNFYIQPTADPTLLHRAYARQPVYDFLKKIRKPITFINPDWRTTAYGSGWSWDDYNEAYMAERAALPVYGNVMRFALDTSGGKPVLQSDIPFFKHFVNRMVASASQNMRVIRRRSENLWDVFPSRRVFETVDIPFETFENPRLLEDTLGISWAERVTVYEGQPLKNLYTQHVDSVLKPMMWHSDNLLAEQSLLMASNTYLNFMNEAALIDTLLKTGFKDLAQKPRWVDGCGLSRYNFFTPQNFVQLLLKMQQSFGMARLKDIFPHGGVGSLQNYFLNDSLSIYAKTGSMSGVLCLSGYLYTQQNKLLLFSILINNHQSSVTDLRRAMETFLLNIRRKY